jgi:hypothetical protein
VEAQACPAKQIMTSYQHPHLDDNNVRKQQFYAGE